MKKLFKRLAVLLVAVFSVFAFTGCGDEFANAQEISKADALSFAQDANVESIADGYKLTMKMNGSYSEGGVSISMNYNVELSVLADEEGNISGIAGNVNMGKEMNMKVYLKDGYFYVDGSFNGRTLKSKTAFNENLLDTYNLADSLESVQMYGGMIMDMLSEESTMFEGATVTVKVVGDTEAGNAKFKIEAKQDEHAATAIVEFKESKLTSLKFESNEQGMSASVNIESITSINYPGEGYFNSFTA